MAITDSLSHELAHLRNEVKRPRSQRRGKATIKDIIYRYLHEFGAATPELVSDLLDIPRLTVAARMTEMAQAGLIKWCGKRYTRQHRLMGLYRVNNFIAILS